MTRLMLPAGLLLLTSACASHQINGTIVDRNGQALERVIITVEPGNVQLVSDQAGAFTIDYLRDDAGERVKLDKKSDYGIEAFKVGYHIAETSIYYKRGELLLEPIVLKEDTIRVTGTEADIDPGQYPDRSQSAGATYEGE